MAIPPLLIGYPQIGIDFNRLWQNWFQNAFDLSAFFQKNGLNLGRDHFKRFWSVRSKSECKQNGRFRDILSISGIPAFQLIVKGKPAAELSG